jgi:hypothetical protein
MISTAERRAANRFVTESRPLNGLMTPDSAAYEIEFDDAICFDPTTEVLKKYTIGEFVGAVAFALACRGDIPEEDASPTMVSNICFQIGRLVEREQAEIRELNG